MANNRDRDSRGDRGDKAGRKQKTKVCQFCRDKVTYIDYKDTALLRKFISDRGKIRARRVTGNCEQHQHDVAVAIKNAREVALLPYTKTLRWTGRDAQERTEMKVILTTEVENLGNPGDIVEVKDGYGRNYLIPQGLALGWTRGSEKQIEVIKRARDARAIRSADHAAEVKAQLEGLTVEVAAQAGDGGRLFGSVTQADVTEAIKAAGGPLVERRSIEIAEPIRSTGTHTVGVRLHDDVSAAVTVRVVQR